MLKKNFKFGNIAGLQCLNRVVIVVLLAGILLACSESQDLNGTSTKLSSSDQLVSSSDVNLSLSEESLSSENVTQSSSSITQEYLENIGPSPFIMSEVDCNSMNMISGSPQTNYPVASCVMSSGDLRWCTVKTIDSELNIATDCISYMEIKENNNGDRIGMKLPYKIHDKTNQIYFSDTIFGDTSVKVYASPDSVFYSRTTNGDKVQINVQVNGSNTTAYKNGKIIINTYAVDYQDMINDTIETLFYHDNIVDKYDVIRIGYRTYYLINSELRGVIGSPSPTSLYHCKVQ